MLLPCMDPREFDVALSGDKPFLVIFSQRGCGACAEMKPHVRKWCAAHPEVFALDIGAGEQFDDIARQHNVRGVPTLLLFVSGERVARGGIMSEVAFGRWMEKHLG